MKERMAITLHDAEFVKRNNPPKDVEISQHEKYEEIINEYVEVQPELGTKTLAKSGIIEGLANIIDFATKDHERITRTRLTGNRKLDNRIKKDVTSYYESRIQSHANEIVSYVNGLIVRDGYPIEIFGNYKAIKQALDLAVGLQKDKYIVDLYISAKTAIPKNILEDERTVVEPAISGTSTPPDA